MIRKCRTLNIETLESREVLSANPLLSLPPTPSSGSVEALEFAAPRPDSVLGPTPEEQEMLELINRMRTDPQGELNRLIKSFSPYEAWDPEVTKALMTWNYPKAYHLTSEWAALSPTAPLAWNFSLYVAATTHSFRMIQAQEQSHQLPGEANLLDRIKEAGYDPYVKPDEYVAASENVYAYGQAARNGFSDASFTHAAFAIDWGVPSHSHRNNIMSPEFSEVGISMLRTSNAQSKIGDWVTTVDFASPALSQAGDGAYLLGVVFSDLNGSGFYEAGEGLSDVIVTITPDDPNAEILEFNPYQAGGYQIYLENGFYTVSVTGSSFSGKITKQVAIHGQNVKVDFAVGDVSDVPPVLDLNGPGYEGIDFQTRFNENGSPCPLVSPSATLTDEDSVFLTSAVITLENRPDGLNEFLSVDTSHTGLKSTYDASTGVMLIFGDATLEDYLSVLKTLEYGNASERADLTDRVVSFLVSDGVNESQVARSYVSVRQQTLETLTVSDVQIEEGDQGMTEMVFQFQLSDIPRCDVYVEYEFVDGTAILGTHYFGDKKGTVHFVGDQSIAYVRLEVPGDYAPGKDLEFTLNITGIYGAACPKTTITGTIWDDDTPVELGSTTSWSSDDLDWTDGRRRLYSFTPSKSGTVYWEAILAEGSINDLTMQLYKTNHEGEPLAEAVDFKGRGRIAWEVENGETYVLLVKGDVVLESLKMVQSPLVIDVEKGNLELELDPTREDSVLIDYENDILQYNGVYLPIRFADYDGFRFLNVGPDHLLQIVVRGGNGDNTKYFDIDPDNPTIPGSGIDANGFSKYEYFIDDDTTVVRMHGTAGDDQFDFRDTVAKLTTSTKKIISVRQGKLFEIYGNGGNDKAMIVDTKYDDTVRFESGKAVFLGGGDTRFDISVFDFTRVDVDSIRGGSDTVYIVNTNDTTVYLDERLNRRIEYDPRLLRSDAYCTWGFVNARVTGSGGSTGPVYLWGTYDAELRVTPGRLVSSTPTGAYKHTVDGYADIRWMGAGDQDGKLSVYYDDSDFSTDSPTWSEAGGQGVLSIPNPYDAKPTTVAIPTFLDIDFYFNGKSKDIRTLPPPPAADVAETVIVAAAAENTTFKSRPAEPLPSLNRLREFSFQRGFWFPGEENDWLDITRERLSLADLALLYEDWNG